LPGIDIPGLFLPQPERAALASSPAYTQARELLTRTERLAIVGYSFGEGDDWIAYDHILAPLSQRKIPAVILKPDANDLAGRIAEDARSKSVRWLSMRWDMFACAVLASQTRPRRKSCNDRRLCARCIDYLYNAFVDSGRAWDQLSRQLQLTGPATHRI
jgi:hypothetical protein